MRIWPIAMTLSLFLCTACPPSNDTAPTSSQSPQESQTRPTPPPFSSLPLKEQLAGCWEQAPDTVQPGTPIQRFQFNPRGEAFTLQRAAVNKYRAGEIVQDVQASQTVEVMDKSLKFTEDNTSGQFEIDTEQIIMDLKLGENSFKLLKLPMICSFENASVKAADDTTKALFDSSPLNLSGDLKAGFKAQISGSDKVYLSVLNKKDGRVLYTQAATFIFKEVAEGISEIVVQGKEHLRLYPSTATPSGGETVQACGNGVVIYSDPKSSDFIKIGYLDKNTFDNPAGLKASEDAGFFSQEEAAGKVIFESSLGDKDCEE